MKLLAVLAAIIIICFVYKSFSGNTYSAAFEAAVNKQPVPFSVHNENAAAVWSRAPEYFHKMKHLFSGGAMQQNDTMIYIPYIPGPGFNKGDSIAITRRTHKDSTQFFTVWFYYSKPDSFAAKEIAYYILTGISRYDK